MKKYNKTSDIVSGQLPNFVSEEYPKFVAFLEAYYRYLETQKINRNIESMRDVDTTLTEFVSILKNELSYAAPNYNNNKFYLPHLKQHFVSRGSEESYNLLFRLLYNKDIQLKYPKDSILKVSDGKWYQDHSIFVKLNSGDIGTLKHKYVLIQTANKSIRIHVDKVLTIDESLGIYEIYFSRNYYGEITIGSTLSFNGVTATLLATTSKIKIYKGGKGFRLGQVFSIPSVVGSISEAAIKVSKIGSGGQIKEIQKIDFGVGYANSFYYTISNKEVEAEIYSFPLSSHIRALEGGGTEIIYTNPSPGYKDPTGGFVDTGYVNRNNYFEYNTGLAQADPLYGSGNYVGSIETQFKSDTASKIIDEDSAILSVELGAVAVYPGYYSATDSFVSGISYIQDGEYYQDFSYIVKVDEKLDVYKNAVLQFLHPTGRKLFGEYSIENDFVLDIQTVLSIIRLRIPDLYNILETVDFFIGKSLSDNVNGVLDVLDGATQVTMYVTKAPFESILSPQIDSHTYYLTKPLSSTLPQQTDSHTYYLDKALSSTLPQQTESNTYYLSKPLSSTLAQQTETTALLVTKGQFESILSPQIDSNTYYLDKPLTSTLAQQTETAVYYLDKPLASTLAQQTESVGLLVTKGAFASILTQPTDSNTYYLDKPLSSTLAQQTDSNTYILGKALSSTLAQQADSNTVYLDKALSSTLAQQTDSNTYYLDKPLSSTLAQQTESTALSIGRSILDTPLALDSFGYVFTGGRLAEDTLTSTDAFSFIPTKNFSESIATTLVSTVISVQKSFQESPINTDTGTLQLNPYYSTDYFSQDYQVGRTSF